VSSNAETAAAAALPSAAATWKVALAGSLAGALSLVLPMYVVKPNRVAEGTAYHLWEIPGAPLAALLVGAVVAAFLVAFLPRSRSRRIALGSASVLVFGLPWVLSGLASELLREQALEFGRVSPAAGTWIALVAAYLLINAVTRSEQVSDTERTAWVALPFVVLIVLFASGLLNDLAMIQEFQNNQERFVRELGTHLRLSGTAVIGATIIGVPLGVLAWKKGRLEKPVFVLVNGIQTIPSLALFGLMIAPLSLLSRRFPVLRDMGIQGIGYAPALIALTLYALLPITRNTYTSLAIIKESVLDSGRGMGMSRLQLLRFVEVPLALPIILGGIRTSAVQAVGNTAVAALIGAGGLGAFVFQGLGQAAPDLILMGVFPIILLAVVVDRIMKYLVNVLKPPGYGEVEG
jgi:osmoprotectant transport system permease protein